MILAPDTTSLDLEVTGYLRFKQKRLTEKSARGYKACLDEFARFFPGHELESFAPPAGTHLIEDFLSVTWGKRSARTYNKNFSIIHNFFEWQVRRGRLHGDPTLPIEKAKTRPFHRTTFDDTQRQAIFKANPDLRDSLGLRLLLDYGIRKGALQNVQLKHFDHERRRLTIFTKGEKVLSVQIPDPEFWEDVDQLIGEGALPLEYLIPWQRVTRRRLPARATRLAGRVDELLKQAAAVTADLDELLNDDPTTRLVHALRDAQTALAVTQQQRPIRKLRPDEQIGEHGLHDWWYRCLRRAGIVADGVRSGERMHKARHSAGQRVYDATGDIKVVQNMLGHKSAQTTLDVYLGSSDEQVADTLYQVIVESRNAKGQTRVRS